MSVLTLIGPETDGYPYLSRSHNFFERTDNACCVTRARYFVLITMITQILDSMSCARIIVSSHVIIFFSRTYTYRSRLNTRNDCSLSVAPIRCYMLQLTGARRDKTNQDLPPRQRIILIKNYSPPGS